MTTAYEQVMASLDERVKALERSGRAVDILRRMDRLEALIDEQRRTIDGHTLRLDAALRRIEQLEREVAVLKLPHSHPDERPLIVTSSGGAYSQAIDQKLENIRNTVELVLGPDEGCPHSSLGPCRACRLRPMPPLPDEGT